MGVGGEIVVGMADLKIGGEGTVLSTVLGSCVGVCLYSSHRKAGGLLHLMMASAGKMATDPRFKKTKYADTGIPELIHTLKISFGVDPQNLVAKLFGGAKILKSVQKNIGEENIIAVKAVLKEYGIPVQAAKLGGENGCRIKFFIDTGKVIFQVFGQQAQEC